MQHKKAIMVSNNSDENASLTNRHQVRAMQVSSVQIGMDNASQSSDAPSVLQHAYVATVSGL